HTASNEDIGIDEISNDSILSSKTESVLTKILQSSNNWRQP
ncbi:10529_t:CDS:1, partial [Cetraspora pellucida]